MKQMKIQMKQMKIQMKQMKIQMKQMKIQMKQMKNKRTRNKAYSMTKKLIYEGKLAKEGSARGGRWRALSRR